MSFDIPLVTYMYIASRSLSGLVRVGECFGSVSQTFFQNIPKSPLTCLVMKSITCSSYHNEKH